MAPSPASAGSPHRLALGEESSGGLPTGAPSSGAKGCERSRSCVERWWVEEQPAKPLGDAAASPRDAPPHDDHRGWDIGTHVRQLEEQRQLVEERRQLQSQLVSEVHRLVQEGLKDMKGMLGTWQVQTQRQWQDQWVEISKLVQGAQSSTVQQLAARLDAVKDTLEHRGAHGLEARPSQRVVQPEQIKSAAEFTESTVSLMFQQHEERLQDMQREQAQQVQLKLDEFYQKSSAYSNLAVSSQQIHVAVGHAEDLHAPSQEDEAGREYTSDEEQAWRKQAESQSTEDKLENLTSEQMASDDMQPPAEKAAEATHGLAPKAKAAPEVRAATARWQKQLRIMQYVSLALVIPNTVFLLYEVQVGLEYAIEESTGPPLWTYIVDSTFTALFCIELCVKLLFQRWDFFCGEEWRWDVFDLVLVITSVIDVVVERFNLVYLRSLRSLRVARVAKIFKMATHISELRLMLTAILNSARSLVWALLLLFLLLLLFSMFILQGVRVHILALGPYAELSDELVNNYGSVGPAIMSLFMAISGGRDWRDLAEPLFSISPGFTFAFVLFISLIQFGILNILTAVFVEAALAIAQAERDEIMQRRLSSIRSIRKLFRQADRARSGMISLAQLERHFQDSLILAHFETVDLDISAACSLFALLDSEGTDQVSIDEYINGMLRLKGPANGVDIVAMMYESQRVVSSAVRDLHNKFDQVVGPGGVLRPRSVSSRSSRSRVKSLFD